MPDRTFTCRYCEASFAITEAEQREAREDEQQNHLLEECPACRVKQDGQRG